MDCIYFYNDKVCYASPIGLSIKYKPTEEEMKKYCQNGGREGFSYCPRYRAYQDHLKSV